MRVFYGIWSKLDHLAVKSNLIWVRISNNKKNANIHINLLQYIECAQIWVFIIHCLYHSFLFTFFSCSSMESIPWVCRAVSLIFSIHPVHLLLLSRFFSILNLLSQDHYHHHWWSWARPAVGLSWSWLALVLPDMGKASGILSQKPLLQPPLGFAFAKQTKYILGKIFLQTELLLN